MKFISVIFLFLGILSSGCTSESSSIEKLSSPASGNSMYPRLFTDNTGIVFMSWLEQEKELTTLKYASLENGIWSEPDIIAADSNWFVNWADFPSIIAHNAKPLAAHWLNKVPGGTYAYEINMSTFSGNWSPHFIPHKDNTATEHGFVSM